MIHNNVEIVYMVIT